MALPKVIQDQLDAADALELQLAGASESQTGQEQTETAAAPESPEVAPQVPTQEPAAIADWEQKYRTLQNKYNNEVPHLHGDIREMKQTLLSLTQQLEQAKQTKPEPQPAKNESLVSEQDREVFGEDLVNLQERIAHAATKPFTEHIQKLEARLAKYEGAAEGAAAQQAVTAEERYFERLKSAAPDYEGINTDPAWIEWLAGKYPGMQTSRQEQLNVARSSLDVAATADMFAAYRELTAKAKPANQKENLNSQVAPAKSKSSTAAPAPDNSTKIWTSAEVVAALDPRRLKTMTPEQVQGVMSEIDAASAEGRVR